MKDVITLISVLFGIIFTFVGIALLISSPFKYIDCKIYGNNLGKEVVYTFPLYCSVVTEIGNIPKDKYHYYIINRKNHEIK